MPHIILNGKHSNTITGLIILNSPPISKPEMRVNVEEIDGLDGDLITELGFKAYDKTFDIGLTKACSADEVAGFFDSEGTVTFSNEPGKYYNYKIVKQIDMEKLLSLRKASVTMHVQPYKYCCGEQTLAFVGDRNLLNVPNYSLTKNGITLKVLNGAVNVQGTSTGQTTFLIPLDKLRLEPNIYYLYVQTIGTGATDSELSVINEVPTTGTCFSTGPVDLLDNELVSTSVNYIKPKIFNYIYLNIPANKTADFFLYLKLFTKKDPIGIINVGNTKSAPILTLTGVGNITLSLNSKNIFNVNLGTENYITIDTLEMEARKDSILKNRLVEGNYDEFRLKPGYNVIGYSGIVNSINVKKYSRWL